MHVMRKYNAKPQRICIFFKFRLQLLFRNVGEVCAMSGVRILFREILCMFTIRNIGIVNYCD